MDSIDIAGHGNVRPSEAAESAERPPFANRGGVTPQKTYSDALEAFIGPSHLGRGMAGIDWLTFTVPTEDARALSKGSGFILAEEGTSRPGFQASERWLIPGGEAWRRMSPREASRVFGLSYESWEAPGYPAGALAERCRSLQGYPTRVDVAFDFSVPQDLMPEDVAIAVAPHAKARGLSWGVKGDRDTATQYFGSRHSDRNLRIYRRDILHPEIGQDFGPLLRIEVELRGKTGKAAWGWYRAGGRERLLRAAAGHIKQMIGVDLVDGIAGVPDIVVTDPRQKGLRAALVFLKQNAVAIQVMGELGIDMASAAAQIGLNKSGPAARKHLQRLTEKRRDLAGVTDEMVKQGLHLPGGCPNN
mgnify:CR=1 FL=1